jgi:ComF family protein
MVRRSKNSMMARSLSKGKAAWEFLLDLIFPKFCVGCGSEGKWVCSDCQGKVIKVATQICPECGRISENGKYCKTCSRDHKLSGIVVAAYYEEGPVKEAIHNLKYNHVIELKYFLGELVAESLQANLDIIGGESILTAVPLHYLRKAQRGYNQAELLASNVAAELKLQKNFKIIKKIRKTNSQVSKSGKKRRENLKNSFKIIDKLAVKNRHIIIVDDVTTTGATLEECAKVLKAAGAKKVWGLVVAKG